MLVAKSQLMLRASRVRGKRVMPVFPRVLEPPIRPVFKRLIGRCANDEKTLNVLRFAPSCGGASARDPEVWACPGHCSVTTFTVHPGTMP